MLRSTRFSRVPIWWMALSIWMVLLVNSAFAQEALGKAGDVWVGKWTAKSMYTETPQVWDWWFVVSLDGEDYSIQTHTGSPAEILSIGNERLEFLFHDGLGTHIDVRVAGPDSCEGTVHQPNNQNLPHGTVAGKRESSFSGYFLRGPSTLEWGSEAPYELFYIKDGIRKRWLGRGQWRLEAPEDRAFVLLGREDDVARSLRAPARRGPFDEVHLILQAEGIGNALADNLKPARLTITVTNVPGNCAALDADIAAAAKTVLAAEERIDELGAQLEALRFPDPWNPETETRLKDSLTKERDALEKATEAEARAKALVENIDKQLRGLESLRRGLSQATTKVGRAFVALGRYKESAKKPQDKIDFIRRFTGRSPRPSANLEDEFDIAFEEADTLARTTVGYGIVQIGGLFSLAVPGPGKYSGLLDLFQLAAGAAVDAKIDSAAFMEEVNLSDEMLQALNKRLGLITGLAQRIRELRDEGQYEEAHDLEVELHRLLLNVLDETTETQRNVESLAAQAKQLYKETKKRHRTLSTRVAQLEEQLKKAELDAENRDYDRLAVVTRQRELTRSLEDTREELASRQQRLTELQELHEVHCPQEGIPIETILVPTSGKSVVTTVKLNSGVTYKLKASSTFEIGGPGYGDAEYAFSPDSSWAINNCNDSPEGVDVGIGIDDSIIDNHKTPFWGTFDSSHVYTIYFVGQGRPIAFNYHDCNYGDNSGSLEVDIFGPQP